MCSVGARQHVLCVSHSAFTSPSYNYYHLCRNIIAPTVCLGHVCSSFRSLSHMNKILLGTEFQVHMGGAKPSYELKINQFTVGVPKRKAHHAPWNWKFGKTQNRTLHTNNAISPKTLLLAWLSWPNLWWKWLFLFVCGIMYMTFMGLSSGKSYNEKYTKHQ